MEEQCTIYDEPASVRSRLFELGLTPEILLDSIEYGVSHKFECTALDPRSFGGILIWGKGTGELRDKLVPDGWTPTNKNNLEAISSPDGETSIVITAGDALTGKVDKNKAPTNRHEKGSETHLAVMYNRQMHFAELHPEFGKPKSPRTWLLLHFVDEEAEEVRVELSLPFAISRNGFVLEWKERIILSVIPFTKVIRVNADDEDDSGELNINVARR